MTPSRSALLVLLCLLSIAPAAGAQEQQPQRGITVVGEASGFAPNDIATFRVGLSERRRTAGAALKAVSTVQRRVIAAVRARGVAAGDIRTTVVSLGRRQVRRRQTYSASNGVVVTVRQVAQAGAVVDAAVRAGATEVEGPEFSASNAPAVYRESLATAFADARLKADRLAREAGIVLGAPIRLVERGSFDEDGGNFLSGGDDDQSTEGASAPVAPGRTRIDAAVTVTFATG